MKTMTRYLLSSLFIVPLALSLSLGEGMARSHSGLTADDVKTVINEGSDDVRRCYRRHVKKQRGADGKFLLHLGVNPSGKVV